MGAEGFDVGGMKDEMDFTTKTRSFQLLHTRARPSSRHFRTTFLPAFRTSTCQKAGFQAHIFVNFGRKKMIRLSKCSY
jgi:hypothetical protein